MSFLKQDLLLDHYHWNTSTDASFFSGAPSRREFNRFNGDQVLFIINYYGAQGNVFDLAQAQQLEELINSQLPLEAKSEITVFNWLERTLNERKANTF